MSATTTDTPQRFTTTTWADVFGPGLSRETKFKRNFGWMDLHDLAVELHERIGLDFDKCNTLVAAAASGLPVKLTWQRVREDDWSDVKLVDTTTTTVVVDQLMNANPGVYNLHYRAWGGGSCIPVSWITDVEAPSAEYDFGRRQ